MKKAVSFLLSLLFLNSPFSYGLNLHYCGEKLVDIASVFTEVEGCGMESESKKTPPSNSIHQSSCCDDVVLLPDLLEDYKTNSEIVLDVEKQLDVSTGLLSIGNSLHIPFVPDEISLPQPPLLVVEFYKEYKQLIVYG